MGEEYKAVLVTGHNPFGIGRFDAPAFEFQESRTGSMRIRRATDGQVITVSGGLWTAHGGKWTTRKPSRDTGRPDTADDDG